ncbi:basement membrane-specific heparan sulfate proteoglycan core protein-like [Salminus brasiliensis]|uniref:basement membrane-specific heparan sulfate proteoglycan core protein-like n=1 Tax=Salminus brasiliensis TaxID=930266 RepID=UPI003B834E73
MLFTKPDWSTSFLLNYLFIFTVPEVCVSPAFLKTGGISVVTSCSLFLFPFSVLISLFGAERAEAQYYPYLSVQPHGLQIFSGETVTLTCVIPGQILTHWTYVWYRNNIHLNSFDKHDYIIPNIKTHQSLNYRCCCYYKYVEGHSGCSANVILTVIGTCLMLLLRPRALLILAPTGQIFSGETVIFTCDIKGLTDTQWRYSWYKDDGENSVYSSDEKKQFSVSVRESDSGKYTCRGQRRSDSQRSEISDAVTLTVSALPRATLTVEPDSTVFTGESVTLKCEIQSYSNWRYQWYKVSSRTAVSQSQLNIFIISSVADQDQYWCKGERDYRPTSSQESNRVYLSVKETPKPELTCSFKGAALRRNPVTLYCKLNQSAGWRFYWSKHTQTPENETTTETHSYTIRSVSFSDGVSGVSTSGAPLSAFSLLSSLMAASPYLLVSIVLGVKCYRAGAQSRTQTGEDQSQYEVKEEDESHEV